MMTTTAQWVRSNDLVEKAACRKGTSTTAT